VLASRLIKASVPPWQWPPSHRMNNRSSISTNRSASGWGVVTPGRPGGTEVTRIYAGDRVSDLLNEASDTTLLVSNLASVQMLRVAELMDVPGICFVGGIEPGDDVIELARANGTLLMVSPVGVFETCGLIYRYLGGERERGANGAAGPGAAQLEAGGSGARSGG